MVKIVGTIAGTIFISPHISNSELPWKNDNKIFSNNNIERECKSVNPEENVYGETLKGSKDLLNFPLRRDNQCRKIFYWNFV